jgi:hypothetical protein
MVMFGPGTTFVHHGSHVFILIALATPLAWLTGRWPVAGAVVTAAGVALAVATYLPYASIPGPQAINQGVDGPISHRALALAAVGAICVAVAFFLPTQRRSARYGIADVTASGPAGPPASVSLPHAEDPRQRGRARGLRGHILLSRRRSGHPDATMSSLPDRVSTEGRR